MDRLNRAGVDGLVGVNLYLRPLADQDELNLISSADDLVEIMEMTFPSAELQSSGRRTKGMVERPLSDGRLLTRLDSYNCTVFLRNSERIGIPKSVLRRFIDDPTDERWLGLNSRCIPELTARERHCFRLFAKLYELAERSCGSLEAMFDWFMGPYPHSRLTGETPAEQIIEGGLEAVKSIVDGLEALLNGKAGRYSRPPRHYDLLAEGQKE